MPYFGTRDLAGITIFAALWGVLNATISPVFFQLFRLPFLCDVIGFAALILAGWWVRKFVAGLIIAAFFMDPVILGRWGGNIIWSGFHAIGGAIGGAVGVILTNALTVRGIAAKGTKIGEARNRKDITLSTKLSLVLQV